MEVLLYTILTLCALGVLSAVILYFVAQKFRVEEDPRIDEVEKMLPGANCGGCGFAGCRGMADALVKRDDISALFCPVGGGEVMKAVAAKAGDDLNDCAIVAGVEVMYDERKKNLDEFINEAGKATRGYIPRSRNIFSVTAEGFVSGTVPKKGDAVGIGANGKIAAGSTGLGTCVDVEVVGRHTYYAIKIGKTEAAAAAKA